MRPSRFLSGNVGSRIVVFLLLALLLPGWPSLSLSVSAQAYGGMVIGAITCDAPNISCRSEIGAQFTVTTEDGTYVGSCTVEGDPNDDSHIAACVVSFPFEITGTLVVTENVDTVTPGYAPQENPIFWESPSPVTRPSHDVVFRNLPVDLSLDVAETSNIAIVPTENGVSVTDACFVLTTFGNVGCDDNGDGEITFRDVPLGTYTVHQTADLGPGRFVDDFSITISGAADSDGWERFYVSIGSTGTNTSNPTPASSSGARDIALITRDPDDGSLLTDGCYVLLEYGNEGCDENGDGQITYSDVPLGVYTVHQTRTPNGYPTIADFEITVTDLYQKAPLGYVVRQAVEQNAPGTRNVSIVFVDSHTHTKVESTICAELVGASERACDDALIDGQIDFLDVPAGTHPIEFTGIPAGWQLVTSGTAGPSVTISADSGNPSNQFVFVEVVVPGSAISISDSSPGGDLSPSGSAAITERTWTAAVTVILCDTTPNGDTVTNCRGGAGIVVNFSLASGEFLGSCTTGDPFTTPWGPVTLSTCTVDGMPFNAEIVAIQDPSTIPPGYVPLQGTSVVRVGNTHPGGGDGTPFSFTNHSVAEETQGLPSANASGDSPTATLLITFRGCPEGFDPAIQDFFANCTIPLDAPDASFIFWGAEGQGGMNIAWLERQYDGAYIYTAWPLTMNVELSGLAPVVRDAYHVIGADGVSGSTYRVHLVDGEVREVFIFYYFE